MMEWHLVTTQAELEAAVNNRKCRIELSAAIMVDLRLPAGFIPWIRGVAGSWFRLLSGHVVARESSHVVAWGSSHVEAWGSSHVVALESSHVVARGSSHVEAWGSSHVEALESSHVVARAATSLSLFGGYVTATATAHVSVHLQDGAKCKGGVQITVKKWKSPKEWCDWYGVKVENGHALLYKAVGAGLSSARGAVYTPGTETVAAGWDGGAIECGGGLHFSPSPGMAKTFFTGATRFIACLVPMAKLSVHPNGIHPTKCKAERCWNWYECNLFGDLVGDKHGLPAKAKPRKAVKRPKAKKK